MMCSYRPAAAGHLTSSAQAAALLEGRRGTIQSEATEGIEVGVEGCNPYHLLVRLGVCQRLACMDCLLFAFGGFPRAFSGSRQHVDVARVFSRDLLCRFSLQGTPEAPRPAARLLPPCVSLLQTPAGGCECAAVGPAVLL